MNNNRRLIIQLLRMYSSKPFRKNTGIRERLTSENTLENLEGDIEGFNNDDMGAYESDFMNVGQSYAMYQREMEKSKEKLKQHIVKSKVFKEIEPRFLTYTEKDQIQKLHENNPEEWTPERLSESFPALPETIRRILKSKWVPKSVDKIIKYDSVVIENWKNLKTGKLVVNPVLYEHLMKFKHRKIILSDRDTLSEKFIPPKMEFPKPKSTMFSNIIKGYIDEKQPICNTKLISLKSEAKENKKILSTTENNNVAKSVMPVKDCSIIKNRKDKLTTSKKPITHNEFIKQQLKQLYYTSPEVGITLLQTYKQHIESVNSDVTHCNTVGNTMEETNNKSNIDLPKSTITENVPAIKKDDIQSEVTNAVNTEHNSSLDTYIKERKINIDTKFEYAKPIKIPQNVWKHGMMYRVKDCYYDYDGEFLYRVPELFT